MNVLFVFGSITDAKRVEKTAAKYGMLTRVIHTPNRISKSGCSYSVVTGYENCNKLYNMLKNSDVKLQSVYKENNISGRIMYSELVL